MRNPWMTYQIFEDDQAVNMRMIVLGILKRFEPKDWIGRVEIIEKAGKIVVQCSGGGDAEVVYAYLDTRGIVYR